MDVTKDVDWRDYTSHDDDNIVSHLVELDIPMGEILETVAKAAYQAGYDSRDDDDD